MFGQTSGNALGFGLFPGFLLAHTDDLLNLQAHTVSVEAQFEQDRSQTAWGKHYSKPVTGLGFNFFNFNNDKTGIAFSVQGNVKFDLIQLKRSSFAFRCGAGIGYLSKRFDLQTNIRNQAIGSHLNGFMQTALIYEHRLEHSTTSIWSCPFSFFQWSASNAQFGFESSFSLYEIFPFR